MNLLIGIFLFVTAAQANDPSRFLELYKNQRPVLEKECVENKTQAIQFLKSDISGLSPASQAAMDKERDADYARRKAAAQAKSNSSPEIQAQLKAFEELRAIELKNRPVLAQLRTRNLETMNMASYCTCKIKAEAEMYESLASNKSNEKPMGQNPTSRVGPTRLRSNALECALKNTN